MNPPTHAPRKQQVRRLKRWLRTQARDDGSKGVYLERNCARKEQHVSAKEHNQGKG